MKGIILAGGFGSRLFPLTRVVSKHLLPVFDKPMIFYSLSTLMLAGVREVLIISMPRDVGSFRGLLGDGSSLGMRITYGEQAVPRGVADAFTIAEEFLCGGSCALILGDNFFHGPGLGASLETHKSTSSATIFAFEVADPSQYGVVEMGPNGAAVSLQEKPETPRSNLAVPGLYFYPPDVVEVASNISPSSRGELEVTEVNKEYLRQGRLAVSVLPRGTVWMDTGTIRDLQAAGEFVRVVEDRTGNKIGLPPEIAWRRGWISDQELSALADDPANGLSSAYLKRLLAEARMRPSESFPA